MCVQDTYSYWFDFGFPAVDVDKHRSHRRLLLFAGLLPFYPVQYREHFVKSIGWAGIDCQNNKDTLKLTKPGEITCIVDSNRLAVAGYTVDSITKSMFIIFDTNEAPLLFLSFHILSFR